MHEYAAEAWKSVQDSHGTWREPAAATKPCPFSPQTFAGAHSGSICQDNILVSRCGGRGCMRGERSCCARLDGERGDERGEAAEVLGQALGGDLDDALAQEHARQALAVLARAHAQEGVVVSRQVRAHRMLQRVLRARRVARPVHTTGRMMQGSSGFVVQSLPLLEVRVPQASCWWARRAKFYPQAGKPS